MTHAQIEKAECERPDRGRHHRRQRPVRHARPLKHTRNSREDSFRRSVGRFYHRNARRPPRGISRASWARPSPIAQRNQLSREYFRDEAAWRGAHHFYQRRRVAPRRSATARFPDPRSVLRSHPPARRYVFRWRNRGARRLRQAHLHAPLSASRGCLRARRREDASRRHLRLHGGPAIFDARGVAYLPPAAVST